MHTAPSARTIIKHGAIAATVAIFAAGLLMGVTGSALGAPPPTLSQAQAQLSKLETQLDQLDQQYDQVQQQLASANQRLGVIDQEEANYQRTFALERAEIGRIAVTSYEDGNVNASLTLLTSGNPQQILNESSILLELSSTNSWQIHHLLDAAKQLKGAQTLAQRTQASIAQLDSSMAAQRANMNKLVSQQQTLVNQLTPAQAASQQGAGGTTSATYTGPTSTQAEKAVAFAYAQLGCPYVYGGTGPCANGYDCSGLTMSAWAYAGISIERTSEDQWASLPHVSLSDLQPGDILVFNGAGHVGLYVGNNELIDAPHTGLDVELVSLSGWYSSTLDGAVRP